MRLRSRPVPRRRGAALTAAVLASLPTCAGVAGATPAHTEDRPFDIAAYDVTIDY